MEKVMNSYESLFIVDLSNGEDAAKETVTKFTTLIAENGEIIDVADWGKRHLAYPINDMNEGYYTVVTFKAPADFIAELDRLFNIDEAIMRKLVIRLEHEPTAKPAVAEPIAEAAEETAEAPVAAEAAADAE
ncbi:MAG: 30S ribosomal protein S6 [Ruminococcaceae bacterium]|nr:30S ribosomal protein S6 [Oscillospiraceae bacterium]